MCSEDQIREAVRQELQPIRDVLADHEAQLQELRANQEHTESRWGRHAHWTHEDQRRVMEIVANFPSIVSAAVRETIGEMLEGQIRDGIKKSVASELETIQLRNDAVRYRQIKSALWKAGLGVVISNSTLVGLIYVIINGSPA